MSPLRSLYGAGIAVRNRLYDRCSLKQHHLQAPVLSIGSISAGGAGKTPFLIMLGELLEQRGIAFNVLSRGYRRKTKGVRLVHPDGTAEEFGDEPLLIARKLGVPVIVGEDRFAAGQFAEQRFGTQAHLLDDGFQHRRLARNFDIVLITNRDLHDTLLPAGRLREPFSSLARASALVFVDGASPSGVPVHAGQHIWRVKRSIVPLPIKDACLAFCGIARPETFFTYLAETGVSVVAARAFRDHHSYNPQDVEALFRQAQQFAAMAFVTTEKDAVNLGQLAEQLRPLHVVPMQMQFDASGGEGPDSAVARICAVLQGGDTIHVRQ